jgi:branched-chain amino acid transport system substrate-binding protein
MKSLKLSSNITSRRFKMKIKSRRALAQNNQTIIIAVVVIIVLAGLAYYLTRPKEPEVTVVEEVVIGAVYPLSGRLAEVGKEVREGIEFTVNEINAAGGIKSLGGAKIKVLLGDSAGAPETGAAEAERLASEENPVLLYGCWQSAVTKTASEVAETYGIPFLNAGSSSPTLHRRGYKWFFRIWPHEQIFSPQQVKFLNDVNEKNFDGQLNTIAIVYEDSEWGLMGMEAWEDDFTAAGWEVIEKISYHAATVTSLDAEVELLKAANPDILLVNAYIHDALLLMRTLRTKNWTPEIVFAQDGGFADPAYKTQVGEDGYYVMMRDVYSAELAIPKLKGIMDRFKEEYDRDMDPNAVGEYQGIYVAYWALEEAGKHANPVEDMDEFREQLRIAFTKMDIPKSELVLPWDGIKFSAEGQNEYATGIIVQMMPDDGIYHAIYPYESATREPIVPFPKWDER